MIHRVEKIRLFFHAHRTEHTSGQCVCDSQWTSDPEISGHGKASRVLWGGGGENIFYWMKDEQVMYWKISDDGCRLNVMTPRVDWITCLGYDQWLDLWLWYLRPMKLHTHETNDQWMRDAESFLSPSILSRGMCFLLPQNTQMANFVLSLSSYDETQQITCRAEITRQTDRTIQIKCKLFVSSSLNTRDEWFMFPFFLLFLPHFAL